MLEVIGQVLPLALALALSTVPITMIMTILVSPTASNSARLFVIGWLAGLFVVAAVFSLTLHAVPAIQPTKSPPLAIALIAVGTALIVYGLWRFRHPHERQEKTSPSRLTRMVSSVRPWPAFGLAVLMNIRPKSLLLMAAIGLLIGPGNLSWAAEIIVLLVVTAVGGSTVATPAFVYLHDPVRGRELLDSGTRWVRSNGRTIALIVTLVIGTVVIGSGLGRF